MKFRKFLQTLFKKTFYFLFKLLYGTIKLNNLENLINVRKKKITNIGIIIKGLMAGLLFFLLKKFI